MSMLDVRARELPLEDGELRIESIGEARTQRGVPDNRHPSF